MIEKTLIPEEKRMEFLPKYLGNHFLKFEMLTYHVMSTFCKGYTGGFWSFYTLGNGGFFMSWDTDAQLHVVNDMNFCDETMSAEAASIGANLYALSGVSFESQDPKIGTRYQSLYEFAGEHEEARKIFRFID